MAYTTLDEGLNKSRLMPNKGGQRGQQVNEHNDHPQEFLRPPP